MSAFLFLSSLLLPPFSGPLFFTLPPYRPPPFLVQLLLSFPLLPPPCPHPPPVFLPSLLPPLLSQTPPVCSSHSLRWTGRSSQSPPPLPPSHAVVFIGVKHARLLLPLRAMLRFCFSGGVWMVKGQRTKVTPPAVHSRENTLSFSSNHSTLTPFPSFLSPPQPP